MLVHHRADFKDSVLESPDRLPSPCLANIGALDRNMQSKIYFPILVPQALPDTVTPNTTFTAGAGSLR